ncbi:class I SAM-dependent methyltransferase [Telmatobacter sp. DSM 110680]|uniref:Class I SAM-dependent methyltransferase n=1 Tax=Telmatobacter sp. DSM 110680 TaxID=3036704 RepID=A0AAU7DGK6_9BACT
MALDSGSLERIIPALLEHEGATGAPTLELHLMRYKFAAEHIQPGRVLDIACGVGYGTKVLSASRFIKEAIGVDISADATEYAQSQYGNDGIKFVTADALEFTDSFGFENIVSLETIEHVPDPRALLGHLTSLLKSGGILIGSVPITPSVDANPHHRTDFTAYSFRKIACAFGLVELDSLCQDQSYDPVAILRGKEKRSSGIRRNIPAYYLANPDRLWARIYSTLQYGFRNRYLTIVWRKH